MSKYFINKDDIIDSIVICDSETKELILSVFKEGGEFKAIAKDNVDFEVCAESGKKLLERRTENGKTSYN